MQAYKLPTLNLYFPPLYLRMTIVDYLYVAVVCVCVRESQYVRCRIGLHMVHSSCYW